jgi:SAM-dependent methyltransferase
MATMPPPPLHGQADGPVAWFDSASGRALLESEAGRVAEALAGRPGQAWLWLAPAACAARPGGHGLCLSPDRNGWRGDVRCTLPLPLANESVATVVVQHVAAGRDAQALLQECARVLVPGGRLWLFGLNALSPYRWRWAGHGLGASEPLPWRRRLRAAGLVPDAVSQGLGPRWRIACVPDGQHGPGLRAAWLLHADKRVSSLTPVRNRARLRIGSGVAPA